MSTLKSITRCRSRAKRVGMCIEWLEKHGIELELKLDATGWVAEVAYPEDMFEAFCNQPLDALLLDACRVVRNAMKRIKEVQP